MGKRQSADDDLGEVEYEDNLATQRQRVDMEGDSSICPAFHSRRGQDRELTSTSGSSFHSRFCLGAEIGSGHFGVVRRCVDRCTNESLACKSILKSRKAALEETWQEIAIMRQLRGHGSIVNLKGVFDDCDALHIMMELCEGGELYGEINNKRCFSEKDAGHIFSQLVNAVAFCHSKGVMHRDLKPENILLKKPLLRRANDDLASPAILKLADFGLAVALKPGQRLRGVVGSPLYMAPEVVSGEYDMAADVWSLGVILYILLSGRPPFWGPTDEETFACIKAAEVCTSGGQWDAVSAEAKLLVRSLLVKDPSRRPSARRILSHPCLQKMMRGGRVVCRRITLRPRTPPQGTECSSPALAPLTSPSIPAACQAVNCTSQISAVESTPTRMQGAPCRSSPGSPFLRTPSPPVGRACKADLSMLSAGSLMPNLLLPPSAVSLDLPTRSYQMSSSMLKAENSVGGSGSSGEGDISLKKMESIDLSSRSQLSEECDVECSPQNTPCDVIRRILGVRFQIGCA